MRRITVKELKQKIANLPDTALVALQSDSEGNSTSTCLDIFIEKIGRVSTYQGYTFVGGEDIMGIDTTKDKDNYVVILQPSL